MRPIQPEPATGGLHIGAKLRGTRRAQGMTIAQVAEAAGLTKGFVSRVERDETSPSVATLVTICQVLSLTVGSLFEEPQGQVVHLDEAPRINLGGSGLVERLVTPRDEGRYQILRSTLEPGASGGQDLYTINCDVESVHVFRGALTLRLPGREVVLGEGDTMTLPGREPHSWRNDGATVTEVVWVLSPAAWSGSA